MLDYTLTTSGYAPKRKFATVEEFKQFFQKYATILIDATQQRTQRPTDSDYQKELYSAGPPGR